MGKRESGVREETRRAGWRQPSGLWRGSLAWLHKQRRANLSLHDIVYTCTGTVQLRGKLTDSRE